MIMFSIIIIIPLFQTLYYSFFEWNGIKTVAFRGIENYKALFKARELKMSFTNSAIYSVILTVFQVGLGTLFSFILTNSKIRGKLIYRNLYFIPVLLSISVVSQLWLWIYNGDFGMINKLAEALGLEWRQQWLNRRGYALIAVAIAEAWKGMGYIMLIIYAAMRNIPGVYNEAASIDGASPLQMFRHITLPLAAPTIRVTIVMCITYGFRAFETTFLMTGGGPGIYTYNLTILMYKSMFIKNDYGYGSAIAMVIVVLCVGLMMLINRLTAKYDEIYR
jgi:raffinose/stachyose/melibiose transport system permease protein